MRPRALVTGVGRSAGIGAAVAGRLAGDGWDLAITYWHGYDERMPWRAPDGDFASLVGSLRARGADVVTVEADLAEPAAAQQVFDAAGPVTALVLSHCESVDSSIRDTTLESFDRHFAVNARASWLLVREFGDRYAGEFGAGRIVALTSDHTAGNLPYGASKGALDRIVLAAAREFADLGVTANVVNPGAIDTGWMDDADRVWALSRNPLGRLGVPTDAANLIAFLCSPQGGWVNGQLLHSDGGVHA